MILSNREIEAAIRKGDLIIDPLPTPAQYTTSAVDLSLGDEMFAYKTAEEIAKEEPRGAQRPLHINTREVDQRAVLGKYGKPIPVAEDGFILKPGQFALSNTREYVNLTHKGKIAARVEGRSTLARLGLVVHLTAPTIHAGFSGRIVLEMYNFGAYPLILPPGVNVCQLIFERVGNIPRGPVRTTHLGQRGVK